MSGRIYTHTHRLTLLPDGQKDEQAVIHTYTQTYTRTRRTYTHTHRLSLVPDGQKDERADIHTDSHYDTDKVLFL